MSKADVIKSTGVVQKLNRGPKFEVLLENGVTIECTLSGKLMKNKIRIIEGDKVDVEMSPYDLSKGRISWRH